MINKNENAAAAAKKNKKSAFDYGAGLLSARDYSKAAVLKKMLQKAYSEDESQAAVKQLEEYGYLDDVRYAERYVQILKERGYGPAYVRNKLAQDGIGRELISRFCIFGAEEQLKMAQDIADDFMQSCEKLDEKSLAKLARHLAAKGYDPSVIYSVLDRVRP